MTCLLKTSDTTPRISWIHSDPESDAQVGYQVQIDRADTFDSSIDIYTKLLLPYDGIDGSTVFIDKCGKIITAVGGAQIDTAQSKFGGASGLFDGIDDYLSIPDSDDWYFGSGDFTIDFWVRFSTVSVMSMFFSQVVNGDNMMWLNFASDNSLYFGVVSGGTTIIAVAAGSLGIVIDTWYHIAVVRSGTSFYIFVDGIQVGTATDSDAIPDYGAMFYIGRRDADQLMHGWIDEFRVSKGIARWTSNFTPPTSAYAYGADYDSEDVTSVNQYHDISPALSVQGKLYVRIRTRDATHGIKEGAWADGYFILDTGIDSVGNRPYFYFTIPSDPDNNNLHFEIQVDSSGDFTSPILSKASQTDQTGWEYYNGSSWVTIPVGGLPPTYYGDQARYNVQPADALPSGFYAFRIRARDD